MWGPVSRHAWELPRSLPAAGEPARTPQDRDLREASVGTLHQLPTQVEGTAAPASQQAGQPPPWVLGWTPVSTWRLKLVLGSQRRSCGGRRICSVHLFAWACRHAGGQGGDQSDAWQSLGVWGHKLPRSKTQVLMTGPDWNPRKVSRVNRRGLG